MKLSEISKEALGKLSDSELVATHMKLHTIWNESDDAKIRASAEVAHNCAVEVMTSRNLAHSFSDNKQCMSINLELSEDSCMHVVVPSKVVECQNPMKLLKLVEVKDEKDNRALSFAATCVKQAAETARDGKVKMFKFFNLMPDASKCSSVIVINEGALKQAVDWTIKQGGAGSGFFGHAGRPGQRGGSSSEGGAASEGGNAMAKSGKGPKVTGATGDWLAFRLDRLQQKIEKAEAAGNQAKADKLREKFEKKMQKLADLESFSKDKGTVPPDKVVSPDVNKFKNDLEDKIHHGGEKIEKERPFFQEMGAIDESNIASIQSLHGGINGAHYLAFKEGGGTVFKPCAFENKGVREDYIGDKHTSAAEMERLASDLDSQVLQMGLVPETKILAFDGKVGSAMDFVKGKNGFTSGDDHINEAFKNNGEKLMAFDMISGALDRHEGNYMVTKGEDGTRRVVAVDNGYAFPNGNVQRGAKGDILGHLVKSGWDGKFSKETISQVKSAIPRMEKFIKDSRVEPYKDRLQVSLKVMKNIVERGGSKTGAKDLLMDYYTGKNWGNSGASSWHIKDSLKQFKGSN